MTGSWPWIPLILLGAYHGLNPGMGWLFALARGLQERSRAAVLWSLAPIALGHAIAIALAILLLRVIQGFVPFHLLKYFVAGLLFLIGAFRLFRSRHPKGGGMRAGWWDLSWWSFLMATSHGAGLMVIPVLLARPKAAHMHDMATPDAAIYFGFSFLLAAVVVHTVSLLSVAGTLALVFYQTYERLGLSLLRKAWFNFDLMWAIALFGAAVAALLL
jgi:hypothetical protein